MAVTATPINAQTLGPNQRYTSTAVATSSTSKGISVQQIQTVTPLSALGVIVRYKVSIDGGTVYGNWRPLGHECNPMVAGDSNITAILVGEFADNIIFEATNTGGGSAAFTLQFTALT